jgi:hypothetical protein
MISLQESYRIDSQSQVVHFSFLWARDVLHAAIETTQIFAYQLFQGGQGALMGVNQSN